MQHLRILLGLATATLFVLAGGPAHAGPDGLLFVPLPGNGATADRAEVAIEVDGTLRVVETLALTWPPTPTAQGRFEAIRPTIEVLASAPKISSELRTLAAAGSEVALTVSTDDAIGERRLLGGLTAKRIEGIMLPEHVASSVEVDGNAFTAAPIAAKVGTCVSLCETVYQGCLDGCAGNATCESACTWRRNHCVSSCNACTPDSWGTIVREPLTWVDLGQPSRCLRDLSDAIASWHRLRRWDRKITTTTSTRDTSCTVTSDVVVSYDTVDCWFDFGTALNSCTINPQTGPGILGCDHAFTGSSF